MTLLKPTFSGNWFQRDLQHVGHDAHVVEHAVVGGTRHAIHDVLEIAHDFKTQMPTVLADTGAVIAAAAAPELLALDATLAAVITVPLNPIGWWNLLIALLKAAPKLAALIQSGEKLGSTLEVDVKTDAKTL